MQSQRAFSKLEKSSSEHNESTSTTQHNTSHQRNVEESLLVNKGSFQGEIRTYKRRHVMSSPQIVITCPADNVVSNFVCRACRAGPACCADQDDTIRDSSAVGHSSVENCNGSQSEVESDYSEGSVTCSECGSTFSSSSSNSSDWSSASSSDDDQDSLPDNAPRMKKFTSVCDLSTDFSSSLGDGNAKGSNDRVLSSNSSSSNSSSSDDDEEEVIMVKIDKDLKDVVDNHIRSRKNSLDSSDSESCSDRRSPSPMKECRSSKESEILQKFLEQVETHPQEEDLDVILEIVGEEDEEPANRSKVNIRECTEKFKDIYARKLKQIYHRKYRLSESSDENDIIKRIEPTMKDVSGNSNVSKLKESFATTSTPIFTSESSPQAYRKDKTMIDKLPEIQQFHPNNIDPKIPMEDRTYLKATSLINEIETCFMETAFLVEKSIGSNKPSSYVLKSEREKRSSIDSSHLSDSLSISNAMSSGSSTSSTNECNSEEANVSWGQDSIQYNLPQNQRVVNEYQTIWNSADTGAKPKTKMAFTQQPDSTAEHTRSSCEHDGRQFKAWQRRSFRDKINRSPRTLEESIEIFEMMLGDRHSDSMKSHDSGLSSSTLVLDSSRFLKEQSVNKSPSGSPKYNSTNNLLDSFDDEDNYYLGGSLNRTKNQFKSSVTLRGKTGSKMSRNSTSDLDDSNYSAVDLQNLKSIENYLNFSNSYKSFEDLDAFSDSENNPHSNIIENNERCSKSKTSTEIRTSTPSEKRWLNFKQRRRLLSERNDPDFKVNHHSNESSQDDNSLYHSKWKSEPDFGSLSYPHFGYQSSSTEHYYDQDYLTTSVTSSVLKNPPKINQLSLEENVLSSTENATSTKEDFSLDVSGGTMGILNEQPLFAQVDELLKGLNESLVDNTSESDEGVVSDQSDSSDCNSPSNTNKLDCQFKTVVERFNENDDEELDRNIEQIVRGINSIKEKHLGRKIEAELENFIRPKIELLRENLNSNMRNSNNIGPGSENSFAYNDEDRKLHLKKEAEDLSEKIKTLAELPEIREILSNMNYQPSGSVRRMKYNKECNALEQISQVSDELKTLSFIKEDLDYSQSSEHQSRRSDYEKRMTFRRYRQSVERTNFTKSSSRSSSCFSYFEEADSGGGSDFSDSQMNNYDQPNGHMKDLSTESDESTSEPNRNSFIMKMLHQNLRCYVITLAFLEKLLNGSGNEQDISKTADLFDNFVKNESEISTVGFSALEKAVSIIPGMAEPEVTSSGADDFSAPFDIGHQAFLQGLHRKHELEVGII